MELKDKLVEVILVVAECLENLHNGKGDRNYLNIGHLYEIVEELTDE